MNRQKKKIRDFFVDFNLSAMFDLYFNKYFCYIFGEMYAKIS